jgi:hypothetical protein
VIDNYRIVSARTRYERFYPSQPLCWKAAAFAHEVNEIFENASECSVESTDVSSDSGSEADAPSYTAPQREIISFGDSMEERTAVRIVADQLNAKPKSVMFVSGPTPSQIVGQLIMLTNHMKFVCDNANILDLEISSEQAESGAASYMKRHKFDYQEVQELESRLQQVSLK